MTNPRIRIYIEETPEHHVGEISLTVNCKPSERHTAELLLSIIRNLEGWAIIETEE